MLFHFVGDLITAPPGSMRKVLIDEPYPDLGPELDLSGPVTGFARLHRIQHAILVQCDLSAPIDCECARCLQPMTHTMQTHFDEEFRFSGHEVEPDSFRLREQHLDLTEAARQYLVLELPINPICRPDCPGLCPACGEPLLDHECAAIEPEEISEPEPLG